MGPNSEQVTRPACGSITCIVQYDWFTSEVKSSSGLHLAGEQLASSLRLARVHIPQCDSKSSTREREQL
jgi:hypothetical protein